MKKNQIITHLSLKPHVEGGFFHRTYQSEQRTTSSDIGEARPLLSSIYYLLTDDSPIGYLHKNRSDIIHYFHSGSHLTYHIIHPDGKVERVVLGKDLAAGQKLQLIVKGGCWKATELTTGEYGLVSEAVCPGFDYADMTIATREEIQRLFPKNLDELDRLIKSVQD
ncbi:MAG: cupin [Gammaproteobacteria bacterium (ex Lamellibrachia satsuma)]|nr:MAG: cupin domain-containing protein [Gammaproteobacteria bacterium (ex Lamellibrachia satsuma)]RRS31826.1 MAG: cupin [Gammaproteobacteria bacterium (ex Lamellibrachia satsuma)]RRS37048.1 MAG: cupin [Gammaproteobacteria bacterium (ex Lamellibrachia satsuma)]